jgi:hypothetical protein
MRQRASLSFLIFPLFSTEVPMPKELFVTLTKSDNQYLVHPCEGWLELFETGVSGSLIVGVWRGLLPDGRAGAPVEVRNVEFLYKGGRVKGGVAAASATATAEQAN